MAAALGVHPQAAQDHRDSAAGLLRRADRHARTTQLAADGLAKPLEKRQLHGLLRRLNVGPLVLQADQIARGGHEVGDKDAERRHVAARHQVQLLARDVCDQLQDLGPHARAREAMQQPHQRGPNHLRVAVAVAAGHGLGDVRQPLQHRDGVLRDRIIDGDLRPH